MAYKAAGRGEQRLGSTFVSPFEASAMGTDETLVECTTYHIQAPQNRLKPLVILKPDSVKRKLVGEIISRFEKRNSQSFT